MDDAVKVGVQSALCSDGVTQPLHTHTATQPLHTDTEVQPLHTHSVTQPLHTHSATQPLHTDTATQPLHTNTKVQPLHTHGVTQPLHTDTEVQPLHTHGVTQPLHTDTATQPLHTDTKVPPLHTHSVTQPLHTHTATQPLHTDTKVQPLHTHSATQPLHTHTATQPLHTDTKVQPLHTHSVTQPMHTHSVTQPLHTHGVTQSMHTHTATQPLHPHTAPQATPVLQRCPQSSNAVPDPAEALWDLYGQLGPALPPQQLFSDAEPLLEPAAAELSPRAGRPQQQPRGGPTPPPTPRAPPQPAALLQDYRHFLAAAGSDFLHAIFNLSGADGDREPPDEHPGGTAEAPPPPPPPPPPAAPTPQPEELQHRLHRLWAALRVPTGERLAMAAKYGLAASRRRLGDALELWDEAAALIQHREQLLALLEGMELRTSHPNRFFQRRRRGLPSSIAFRGETKARRRLDAAVLRCEGQLQAVLRRLREEFGDVVRLKGRSYEEKLRWDRGEMLYRLQQGRRAAAMGGVLLPRGGGR
uniref:Uncharacterized protein n=1 Tax=Gallus gallus TaxID=9031 RepID=A0A8V0X7Z6_CHICK